MGFKLNLLAPARGDPFVFRAKVVKLGPTIAVCEAQAFAISGGWGNTDCHDERHDDGARSGRKSRREHGE